MLLVVEPGLLVLYSISILALSDMALRSSLRDVVAFVDGGGGGRLAKSTLLSVGLLFLRCLICS
jgi:hypothetical protein